MNFAPLLHGAAGPFDELILAAEGMLVLALIITFLRSRGRKPAPPPAHKQGDLPARAEHAEPR